MSVALRCPLLPPTASPKRPLFAAIFDGSRWSASHGVSVLAC
jgi:hypothetical protein